MEVDVPFAVGEADDRVLRIGDEVAVREHRALRQSGRPARVEDAGEVLRVDDTRRAAVSAHEVREGEASVRRLAAARVDEVLHRVAAAGEGTADVEELIVYDEPL